MVCIYGIKNTKTGKIYIGSTTDMTKRFKKHKTQLRNNKHCNEHLQRAWNKYGEDFMDFIILTTCGKHQLLKKEREYIEKYHSLDITYGYNLVLPLDVPARKISKQHSKNLSDAMKGKTPSNFHRMQKKRWRKVNVFENGVLKETFESVRVTEEKLGIKRCNVHNYLTGKTTGIKHFKHLHFEYAD